MKGFGFVRGKRSLCPLTRYPLAHLLKVLSNGLRRRGRFPRSHDFLAPNDEALSIVDDFCNRRNRLGHLRGSASWTFLDDRLFCRLCLASRDHLRGGEILPSGSRDFIDDQTSIIIQSNPEWFPLEAGGILREGEEAFVHLDNITTSVFPRSDPESTGFLRHDGESRKLAVQQVGDRCGIQTQKLLHIRLSENGSPPSPLRCPRSAI